jgi:hypothetical protein
MKKEWVIFIIYNLIVSAGFGYIAWRIETLPVRLEQTLQTVSNQIAIDSECVDENDFFTEGGY